MRDYGFDPRPASVIARERSEAKERTHRLFATLTPAQDARYGQLFQIAAEQLPASTNETDQNAVADAEAWKGLCEEWPELKQYDGAKS